MAVSTIGKFLLNIPQGEFDEARKYFAAHPDEKKFSRKDSKLTYSYIKVKIVGDDKQAEEIIAVSHGEALGEGAYAKVMLCEDGSGNNLAVKIGGVGKKASDEAEITIGYAVGFIKGAMQRKLKESKLDRGIEISEKEYILMELKPGKELFQLIYSSKILMEHPGYLYSPEEVEPTRNPLSIVQRYILAIKLAQDLQELHNRRIVHGDPKPANWMGNIEGNRMMVARIDFGLSSQLAPEENKIESPKKPEGTPDRYIAPEVLQVANGLPAVYSFASDAYSLGKVFKYDLQLPHHLYDPLIQENPQDRMALPDMIRLLAKQLEALPESQLDSEAKKVLAEIHSGVQQSNESEGPEAKTSFIAQILSGYRDPREIVGVSRSAVYTTEDYTNLATIIYSVLPPASPSGLFDEMIKAYAELTHDDERAIFLHNAELFLKKLLDHDLRYRHLDLTHHGINHFISHLEAQHPSPQLVMMISSMKERLNAMILERAAIKRQNLSSEMIQPSEGELDIHQYIHVTLAESRSARDLERRQMMLGNADAFASDLYELQKRLIKNVNITDFYNKAWSEDKDKVLAIQNVTKYFNQMSYMVISDLLTATSGQHQLNVFSFYIQVLKSAIEKGDFQTAMAINAAFMNTSIYRLELEKDLSPDDQHALVQVRDLFSTSKSSKNLRDEFAKRRREGKPVLFPMNLLLGSVMLSYEGVPEKNKKTKKLNDVRLNLIGRELREKWIEPVSQFIDQSPHVDLQTNMQVNLEAALSEDENSVLSKLIKSKQGDKASFRGANQFSRVLQEIKILLKNDATWRDKTEEQILAKVLELLDNPETKIDNKIIENIRPQLNDAIAKLKQQYAIAKTRNLRKQEAPVQEVKAEIKHRDSAPPGLPSKRQGSAEIPLQGKKNVKAPRVPPRGPFYIPESTQESHLPGILRKGPTAEEWAIAKEYFRKNPSAVKLSRRSTEPLVSHSFLKVKNEKGQDVIYVLRLANETGKVKTLATGKKGKLRLAEDENGARFAVKVESYNRQKINESEISILKELNFYHGHARRVLNQVKTLGNEPDLTEKMYTVMPYVPGHDLFSGFLRPSLFSSLSERDKLEIGLQLVKKVKWLHAKGILHRDLKAQNTLVKRNARGGWDVFPFDWETAIKLGEDNESVVGRPLGTKGFQAPELKGEQWTYTAATDVYALGIILKIQLGIDLPEVDKMLSSDPMSRPTLRAMEETLSNKLSTALPSHYFDIKNKIINYIYLEPKERMRVLNHLASTLNLVSEETRQYYLLNLEVLQKMHEDIQTQFLPKHDSQKWIADFYSPLKSQIALLAVEKAIIDAQNVEEISQLLNQSGFGEYDEKVKNILLAIEEKAQAIKEEELFKLASIHYLNEVIDKFNYEPLSKQASEKLKILLKEKYTRKYDWDKKELPQTQEEKPTFWNRYNQSLKEAWQGSNFIAKPLAPFRALAQAFKKEPVVEKKTPPKRKKAAREWVATEKALLEELNIKSTPEAYRNVHQKAQEEAPVDDTPIEENSAYTVQAPSKRPPLAGIPTKTHHLKPTPIMSVHQEHRVFAKELIDFFNHGTHEEKVSRKNKFGVNVIKQDATGSDESLKLIFSAQEASKTNTVYVIPSQDQGVSFAVDRKVKENPIELERVIMQVCALAVATAKPGADFTINEKEEGKKQQIREALYAAVKSLEKENPELAKSLKIEGRLALRKLPPPRPPRTGMIG